MRTTSRAYTALHNTKIVPCNQQTLHAWLLTTLRSLQYYTGSQIPQNPDFEQRRLSEPVCAKEELPNSWKMEDDLMDEPMDDDNSLSSVS
jgi:hypothetical protein